MALRISQRVALVAESAALASSSSSSSNSSHGRAGSASRWAGSPSSAKCCGGIRTCAGGAHRSSATATLQLEAPSSTAYSPKVTVSRRKSSSLQKGKFVREDAPRKSNSPTLIDIEDSVDGSVTFRYGPAEDLWDLDKLLQALCKGAFKIYNPESFVALVTEVFGLPASKLEQRRIAKVLAPHVGREDGFLNREDGGAVSSILAEEASKFLPLASVGSYRKGGWRPRERVNTVQNEWWRDFDGYLGVGDEDFQYEQSSEKRDGESQPAWSPGREFQPEVSSVLDGNLSGMFMSGSPMAYAPNWFESAWNRSSLEPSKVVTADMVPEGVVRQVEDTTSGEDFLRSARGQRAKFRQRSQRVKAADPTFDRLRTKADLEHLPIASIRAMVDWDQGDEIPATSRPYSEKASVKATEKKPATKLKSKNAQRSRGSTNTARIPKAPKKKSGNGKAESTWGYDVFCALPVSHKASGVATFLQIRRAISGELPLILNYVAVGLAATGLAATLHVGARMLCVNATFDFAKMLGVMRGVSLVCLSAAIEGVRKAVLLLPPDCGVSDVKDKAQLLCLQQCLRRLTSTAMAVMVIAMMGTGI